MIKICVICRKEFESSQPKARYCCFRCKQEGRRIISRRYAQTKREEQIIMSKENPLRIKTCVHCGKTFYSNAHNRKYCDICSKKAWKYRQEKSDKEMSIEAKKAQKTAHPPGTTVCTASVAKKCKYGSTCGGTFCCNYILVEGHSRGCPSRTCDKYKRGPKKRDNAPIVVRSN